MFLFLHSSIWPCSVLDNYSWPWCNYRRHALWRIMRFYLKYKYKYGGLAVIELQLHVSASWFVLGAEPVLIYIHLWKNSSTNPMQIQDFVYIFLLYINLKCVNCTVHSTVREAGLDRSGLFFYFNFVSRPKYNSITQTIALPWLSL